MRSLKVSQIALRCHRRRLKLRKFMSKSKKTSKTAKTERIMKTNKKPKLKKKLRSDRFSKSTRTQKKRKLEKKRKSKKFSQKSGNKTTFKPPRVLIQEENAKSCFQKMLDYTSSLGDPTESFSCDSSASNLVGDETGLEGLPKPEINQFFTPFQTSNNYFSKSRGNTILHCSQNLKEVKKISKKTSLINLQRSASGVENKNKIKKNQSKNRNTKKKYKKLKRKHTQNVPNQKTNFQRKTIKKKKVQKRRKFAKNFLKTQELRNLTIKSFELENPTEFDSEKIFQNIREGIQKEKQNNFDFSKKHLKSVCNSFQTVAVKNKKKEIINNKNSEETQKPKRIETNKPVKIKKKIKKCGLRAVKSKTFKEDFCLKKPETKSYFKSKKLRNQEIEFEKVDKNILKNKKRNQKNKNDSKRINCKKVFSEFNSFIDNHPDFESFFGVKKKSQKILFQTQNFEKNLLKDLQIPIAQKRKIQNNSENSKIILRSEKLNKTQNLVVKNSNFKPIRRKPKPIKFEILKLKGGFPFREEKFKIYVNESDVLKINNKFRSQWMRTECINRSIDDDCVTEDEHISYSLNRTFKYFCKYLRHNQKLRNHD